MAAKRPRPACDDADYFSAYGRLAVHHDMLSDAARTAAYKRALQSVGLAGKTVLDVGAGTGLLSVFAAAAGARRVYAVEASPLAESISTVAASNGVADRVTVLHGRLEDVTLPERVDVLVSEWMGYALVYEGMLPSVLAARDAWLKPGGLMLPSHATLLAAPFADDDRYAACAAFWADVHGVDLSCLAAQAQAEDLAAPQLEPLPPDRLLSWPVPLRRLDLRSITAAELLPWSLPFDAIALGRARCCGLSLWFSVDFHTADSAAALARLPQPPLGVSGPLWRPPPEALPAVTLGTGPEEEGTHWMSTQLYLEAPLAETAQGGLIRGTLRLAVHPDSARWLTLGLSLEGRAEKVFELT